MSLISLCARYLQKMLSRVITPLDSFTCPAGEFSCSWARQLITEEVGPNWAANLRLFDQTHVGLCIFEF